jgi:hypothetical protein
VFDSLCFKGSNSVGFFQDETDEITIANFVLLLFIIFFLMEECPNLCILLLSFFQCFDKIETCKWIELVINLFDRQWCFFTEISLRHMRFFDERVNSFPDRWNVLEMLINFLDFFFVHYYYKRNALSSL